MLWADLYVNASYVAFIDTDAVFTTVVTYQSMFIDGKPVVRGVTGEDDMKMWRLVPNMTQFVIGKPQPMRCMSYFPVVIRTKHLRQLRQYVEETHQRPFDSVIQIVDGHLDGWCHFAIICSYIWYFHYEEYSFFVHKIDTNSSAFVPGQLADFNTMINMTGGVKVRNSNHFRWYFVSKWHRLAANSTLLTQILRTGYCYATGFKSSRFCTDIGHDTPYQDNLYSFEMIFSPFSDEEKRDEFHSHSMQCSLTGHTFDMDSETLTDLLTPETSLSDILQGHDTHWFLNGKKP